MTIAADSNGVVVGKFQIPADVPAGIKNVTFAGAGGSGASAIFSGQGTLVEDIRTLVSRITTDTWVINTTTWINNGTDPIAQTFTLTEAIQLEAIDLYFTAIGTTTVAVQIRETQTGYPTQTVLADTRLDPSAIGLNAWTRFNFSAPARLEANTEYSIVALCNDSVSALAVAELGKFDSASQQWITSQPYTVGVLLSSSNASTWTAYQDRDLAFRLQARKYTETSKLVNLGSVTITDATDLLVMTMIESPKSSATGDLEITLPDGTVITAGDNQRITFSAATTGTVGVKARLRADDFASAALYPGTQIIQGKVHFSDTYISNAIDADVTGCTVKVLYDAVIPSGATVTAEISGVDVGDSWLSVTAVGSPKLIDGNIGLYEYQFQRTSVLEARVRVRLTLTGTVTARPRVRDLRVIVL